MHRAQGKQKTIKQEGHNSLCPYKIIKTVSKGFDLLNTPENYQNKSGRINSTPTKPNCEFCRGRPFAYQLYAKCYALYAILYTQYDIRDTR